MRKVHTVLGQIYQNSCGLPWVDWLSIAASALAFAPDLVVELGRGVGTSTALFSYLRFPVVSICNTNLWTPVTVPRLSTVLLLDWSQSVRAIVGDINEQDHRELVEGANRVLLFWDAHGYAVAETVLSRLLPRTEKSRSTGYLPRHAR